MRFRFVSCVLALLVLVPTPGRTQPSVDAPTYTIALGDTDATELIAVQRDGVLVIGTDHRVAAYDARTGARLWSRDDVRSPALTDRALYVARDRSRPSEQGALMALAPRTGEMLWERTADVAGPIVVDDAGIIAGGNDSLGAFGIDGKPRWTRPWEGRYIRILSLGGTVLVNSFRNGALLHGELESFDRSTGVRRGTTGRYETGPGHAIIWFEPLFDVRGGHAYGANDFIHDYDTACTKRDIIDVDLATMSSTERTYVLEPPPSPPRNVCIDERQGRPTTTIANGVVALGNGTLTAFYRVGSTTPLIPVVHDATLVGGPFAGYYFLNRTRGLEALRLDAEGARTLRFRTIRAHDVAVAGIADRLYVATRDAITTFAVGHFDGAPLRRFGADCPVLTAIGRAGANDLVICRDEGERGETLLLALPR